MFYLVKPIQCHYEAVTLPGEAVVYRIGHARPAPRMVAGDRRPDGTVCRRMVGAESTLCWEENGVQSRLTLFSLMLAAFYLITVRSHRPTITISPLPMTSTGRCTSSPPPRACCARTRTRTWWAASQRLARSLAHRPALQDVRCAPAYQLFINMCKQLPALALLVFPDAPTASLVIILISALLVAAATAGFKRVCVPPCTAGGLTRRPADVRGRQLPTAVCRRAAPVWQLCGHLGGRRGSGGGALSVGAPPAVVADMTVRAACGSENYQAGDGAKDLASVLLIGLAVIVAVCFCWVLALHLRARKERAQVR